MEKKNHRIKYISPFEYHFNMVLIHFFLSLSRFAFFSLHVYCCEYAVFSPSMKLIYIDAEMLNASNEFDRLRLGT